MCCGLRLIFSCFVIFLAWANLLAFNANANTFDLSGHVHITKVSDGDSMRSGDLRIRLFGIDAPELKQQCANQNGVLWGCGAAALRQLKTLIGANKDLRCNLRDVDKYGRLVMQCFNGSSDIGAAMVRSGHALAYRHFSDLYVADEELAKTGLKGVWQGKFSPPWEWRLKH